MEPKFEQPKQYTPEEIAGMEKSRTISDAELLKGGAEYSINEKGEKENLLAGYDEKIFFEDKRSQNTINILQRTFKDIEGSASRDGNMRNVSLKTIESVISNAHEKLYATYNERHGHFRLWSDKPKINSGSDREAGHVDWSTDNYGIALAQAKESDYGASMYELSEIKDLMEKVNATQEDSVSGTLLMMIPKQ